MSKGYWIYNKHNPDYRTMSVIGDSISTYRDFSVDTSSDKKIDYYPTYLELDVTETWWHMVADEIGAVIQQNNSRSGSTICWDGYNEGIDDNKGTAFIDRMKVLAPADLIIIEGATNDNAFTDDIGEYKYADWTDADLSTFRPACAYMLDYMTKRFVNSKIVFLLNNGLSADISASVETICEHYNVPLCKLSNITKDVQGHPTKVGMEQVAEQLTAFIEELA